MVLCKMRKTALEKSWKYSTYVFEFFRVSINYKILCIGNIFMHRCKGSKGRHPIADHSGEK